MVHIKKKVLNEWKSVMGFIKVMDKATNAEDLYSKKKKYKKANENHRKERKDSKNHHNTKTLV